MIREPHISLNIIAAQNRISNQPIKVLFIGQKLASGTATPLELIENIQNDNSWDTLFGKKSMLAYAIRRYKSINPVTRIDAISLADAGGSTKATGTITFTGTATENENLVVNVGSKKYHSYIVEALIGDTATVLAGKLVSLINADTASPVSAANVAGVVTVTAENGGQIGNNIPIAVEGIIGGVTTSVTAMTGGTVNPSLTTVFDDIQNLRYKFIVAPFEYGYTYLADFLEPRINVNNNILDGSAIINTIDTFANLFALGNSQNYSTVSITGDILINETNFKGARSQELNYGVSAQLAAIYALRLTDGANISRYVTTSASKDQFGSMFLSSLPLHNTPLFNIIPWLSKYDSSQEEINQLNAAGITSFGPNSARSTTILGRVLTTYKTDNAGNTETTFKYFNDVLTSSAVREYFVNNLRDQYSEVRISSGDIKDGRAGVTEPVVRDFIGRLYTDLGGVLTQIGIDSNTGVKFEKFFNDNLIITIDVLNKTINTDMKVPIVSQLLEIFGVAEIRFDTNTL